MIAIREILVPTDFSDTAEAALAYAKELAAKFGSRLHLLHVVATPQAGWAGDGTVSSWPALLADLEDDARQRLNQIASSAEPSTAPVCLETIVGIPVASILDYAQTHHIDLIVMGTHGRGFMGHVLLGSVAERVVRLAQIPVLTVHGAPQRAAGEAQPVAEKERMAS